LAVETNREIAMSLEGLGTLEVQLRPMSKERKVHLLPLDAGGKLPALKAPVDVLAFQLQADVKNLGAEAKPDMDRVSFAGLKAGVYQAVSGPASADATVKPGKTVKVELSAKR
jgi:hypothetical protein